MTHLKLSEAKAHLGHYAKQAREGKTYILTDRNKPVASLVPFDDKKEQGIQPKFGLAQNLDGVQISDEFNDPIESFENDFYGTESNP